MSQALAINPIGTPFIELQSIDSTNNYARQLISGAGLPDRQVVPQHGMVIFAHEQTAGKGQRGRVWSSDPGKNIMLSALVRPSFLRPDQQFQLSASAAVAVCDFFIKYAIDKVAIKWPNDLYWQDRKAGGILIESVIGTEGAAAVPAQWQWAIIGTGININQAFFPEHLPNPVSLKQITGSSFKIIPLVKELCTLLQEYYTLLMNGRFEEILARYNQYLYKRNEKVKLKKDNRVFEARVKSVNPAGKLIIEHSWEEELGFGEAEWLISEK
ncbi:MAG: biotin--[acetyl-CoA-carboxylase] ligase [Chitinophagaceae bacterium]